MKHNNDYDLIILGSGLVGSTLALLLAPFGLKILLLDKQSIDLNWNLDHHDLRVSAINRRSENIFRQVQIWESIQRERISPYHQMSVWDQSIDLGIHFSASDIHQPNLGYIIENKLIQKKLFEKIQEYSNVKIIYPIEAKAIEVNENHVKLYTNQQTFSAKLLIGSDGVQSWVRQEMDFAVDSQDYQQHALVCEITTEKSHLKTAWQRFLPSGPLAFLPLSDPHRCSIVWSATTEAAMDLQKLEKNIFLQELLKNFGAHLGDIVACSERILFPLSMMHAKNYVKPRIALMGDSAHKIHPLAGQGLNLGLADAQQLHEIILATQVKKRDIGHISNLRVYERSQRPINQMMATTMTAFNQLFSNENNLLTRLRNTGVNVCNRINFIKNYFTKQALGSSDRFYCH